MDRRMVAYAILLGALVGVLAWLEYYPATPMITTIGLPGPEADTERRCGSMYRQVGHKRRIPTREVVCRGRGYWGYVREDQRVTLDALTRRISNARRLWSVPDSATWQKTRDSVTSTIQRLGGRPVSCWESPYPFSVTRVRATHYWIFPSYAVRFISYRFPDEQKMSPWMLQLDGYPELPEWCFSDPWRYNR